MYNILFLFYFEWYTIFVILLHWIDHCVVHICTIFRPLPQFIFCNFHICGKYLVHTQSVLYLCFCFMFPRTICQNHRWPCNFQLSSFYVALFVCNTNMRTIFFFIIHPNWRRLLAVNFRKAKKNLHKINDCLNGTRIRSQYKPQCCYYIAH